MSDPPQKEGQMEEISVARVAAEEIWLPFYSNLFYLWTEGQVSGASWAPARVRQGSSEGVAIWFTQRSHAHTHWNTYTSIKIKKKKKTIPDIYFTPPPFFPFQDIKHAHAESTASLTSKKKKV